MSRRCPCCNDELLQEYTAFKPFGRCTCTSEMLYRRLRAPTTVAVQKNLSEAHYVSEKGQTFLNTQNRVSASIADAQSRIHHRPDMHSSTLNLKSFDPIQTIIWTKDDLGLRIQARALEHDCGEINVGGLVRAEADEEAERPSGMLSRASTPKSLTHTSSLNALTRASTPKSENTKPETSPSITAPRARTSHSIMRGMEKMISLTTTSQSMARAMQRTGSFSQLLHAPTFGHPVRRLEPLDQLCVSHVGVSSETLLSKGSLLSSGSLRPSRLHASAPRLPGLDRPHQASSTTSSNPHPRPRPPAPAPAPAPTSFTAYEELERRLQARSELTANIRAGVLGRLTVLDRPPDATYVGLWGDTHPKSHSLPGAAAPAPTKAPGDRVSFEAHTMMPAASNASAPATAKATTAALPPPPPPPPPVNGPASEPAPAGETPLRPTDFMMDLKLVVSDDEGNASNVDLIFNLLEWVEPAAAPGTAPPPAPGPSPTGEACAPDSPTRLQLKFEGPDDGTAGKVNLLLDVFVSSEPAATHDLATAAATAALLPPPPPVPGEGAIAASILAVTEPWGMTAERPKTPGEFVAEGAIAASILAVTEPWGMTAERPKTPGEFVAEGAIAASILAVTEPWGMTAERPKTPGEKMVEDVITGVLAHASE